MLNRRLSFVALSVLLAACGGKALWDPDHHSNHHPATSGSTASAGGSVTVASAAGTGGSGGAVGVGGAGGTSATSVVASSSSTGGTMLTTSLEELPLGEQFAGIPIAFDVPDGTLGFTVVVKTSLPYGRIGVQQIVSPAQEAVVDGYSIPGTDYTFSWYGLTPAGVPQSDVKSAFPKPLTGKWNVTIGDPFDGATSGTVSVWLRKSSDGVFHGGQLDLNVFRVPSVSSDVYIDAMLHKAYDGWAGLTVGTITHYPLDEKFSSVDGTNYLPTVEQSKVTSNTPAVNVYVIEKFTNDLKDAIGVAAGIPGVGIAPGSHSSGVVIMPTSDPDTDAVVLKHESGHLSGLFHTSEIMGGTFDPLADTPTCGNVQQEVFGCPDAGNIMFPYANPAATDFSEMQTTVIHGSTLYRGAYDNLSNGPMKATPLPPQAKSNAETSKVAHGAWRSHLSPRAANFIASHWCHHAKNVDHAAVLARFATASELNAVAVDPSAPSWIRSRAKRAAQIRR